MRRVRSARTPRRLLNGNVLELRTRANEVAGDTMQSIGDTSTGELMAVEAHKALAEGVVKSADA